MNAKDMALGYYFAKQTNGDWCVVECYDASEGNVILVTGSEEYLEADQFDEFRPIELPKD